MADDQNQKPSTIDDLVKELSKNNSSNQPPPNLPGVKIDPERSREGSQRASTSYGVEIKPPITGLQPTPTRPEPPRPIQPPPAGGPSKPTPPTPLGSLGSIGIAKPPVQPPPAVAGQVKPSPVQEYRSSIRTMGEDITSLKSGQKPAGIDIPRKVVPEMPKAPIPGAPETSLPSGPAPAVGLGRAEKTGLLPTQPTSPTSSVPKKPTELPKPLTPQPPITVPSQKGISFKSMGFMSSTMYIFIAGILVVAGFLYWFLVLRTVEPEVVLSPTPTPTQTATPTPAVKNLSEIFKGIPVNFEVVLSDSLGKDFKTFVNTLSVANREFIQVNLVENVDDTLVPLTFLDMFDMDLILYPTIFRDNVLDSTVVVYGQSEAFNKDGSVNFNPQNLKKTAFISRVRDMAVVEAMMREWELAVVKDLADYLSITDTSKEASVNFLDNIYRGATIRYKNFPFPDVTVDYSVVEAVGQSYLVIAGSKETMYSVIDVLIEQ